MPNIGDMTARLRVDATFDLQMKNKYCSRFPSQLSLILFRYRARALAHRFAKYVMQARNIAYLPNVARFFLSSSEVDLRVPPTKLNKHYLSRVLFDVSRRVSCNFPRKTSVKVNYLKLTAEGSHYLHAARRDSRINT